ncbi:hypothetical protein JTB14_025848 [Gonioctena quinquepunctata]|nr:hypothetical protein JTB14_025848 [Gonioctena quinquepunctata]
MPTKQTFSQVTGGVKECILPKNNTEVLLTMERVESVEETILDKIIESGKKAATKPHSNSSHNRPGWVALMCANNTNMQWLKKHHRGHRTTGGPELRVVEEAEMPHNEILMAYLPGIRGDSTEKFLGLIEAQNGSLDATNWRVLRRSSDLLNMSQPKD